MKKLSQTAARPTGRAGCFAFRRSVTRRRAQGAKATGETKQRSPWTGTARG